MNLSTPVFAALLSALLLMASLRPARLIVVWVVALLVFPMARFHFGQAPVYVYDLVMGLILPVFYLRGIHRYWPTQVPRWHWWLIGVAWTMSVAVSSIQRGFSLESVWICGHSSLAWMAFGLGILASASPNLNKIGENLRLGIFISLALLAPVAVIQYLDLPQAGWLMEKFYGDMGATETVDRLRVGLLSNRAPGPHFAPTTFGGVALLALGTYWMVSRQERSWKRWTMLAMASIIVVCTVSRHVIVAAACCLIVIISLGEARLRRRVVTSFGVGLAALLLIAPSMGILESWQNRVARLDEGMLRDENVTARILEGPFRLVNYISRQPATLLTGAGLEADKVATQQNKLDIEDTGFVSNGVLLALYYLGLPGMAIYIAFWVWMSWKAYHLPRDQRAVPCGVLGMVIIIIVADNYGFIYEPAVALVFVLAGLIGSYGLWQPEISIPTAPETRGAVGAEAIPATT